MSFDAPSLPSAPASGESAEPRGARRTNETEARPARPVGLALHRWWKGGFAFLAVHAVAVVGAFFADWTWSALALVLVSYYVRMFGITAGMHRYFAHRGFKATRGFQFFLGLLGTLATQRSILWWSGHHIHHHKHSDDPQDIHSPKDGFWWSHMVWMLVPDYNDTPERQIRAFEKYPEILFLHNHWPKLVVVFPTILFLIGGWHWLYWGYFVSTVLLWHGTFTINSLSHVWGRRRYATTDTSRNNALLSLITMGEGWHNNHHHYPSTANQGFFWWEIDLSYVLLRGFEKLGLVWDLRTPPKWVLEGRAKKNAPVGSALVANHRPDAAAAAAPARRRRAA